MQNPKRPPEEETLRYDQFSKKTRLDSDQGTQYHDVTDRNNSNRMVKVDIPITSTQSYSIQGNSNIPYINASTSTSQALQFVGQGAVSENPASSLLRHIVFEKLHIDQNSGQTSSNYQTGNQCQQNITQGRVAQPCVLQDNVLLQRASNLQNGLQDGSEVQHGIQYLGANIQSQVQKESELQNKYTLNQNEISTQHVTNRYGSLEGQVGTLQVEQPTSSFQVEHPASTVQLEHHQLGTIQVEHPNGTAQVELQPNMFQVEGQLSKQLNSVTGQQNSGMQSCQTLQTNNLQDVVSLGNGVNVTNITIPAGVLKAPFTLPVSAATPISGANVVYVRPATDGSGATIVQQGVLTPTKKVGSNKTDIIQNISLMKPSAINNTSQAQPLINSGGVIRQVYYVSATNSKTTPVVNSPKKEKPSPNIMPGTSISYKTPGASYRNRNGNIKRPMNAFMLWARNYRRHLSLSMPSASNAEISVRLGQVWGNLPAEEKQEFYREAERIKMQHHRDFPGWVYKPNQTKKEVDTQHERLWAKYGNKSGTTHTVVVSPNPKTAPKTTVATPNSRSSSSQTDISITYPTSSSPHLSLKDPASKIQLAEANRDPVVKSTSSVDSCSVDSQQTDSASSDSSNKSDKKTPDAVAVTQKLPSISTLLKKSNNLLNSQKASEQNREHSIKILEPSSSEQTPTVERNPVVDVKSTYIFELKSNASAEDSKSNNVRQTENSQDTSSVAKTTTRRGRPPSVTKRVEDPFPKEACQSKNKKIAKDADKQTKNKISSSKKISKSKSDKDDLKDKSELKDSPLKESDFHRKATPNKSKIGKNNAQSESATVPPTTAHKEVSKAESREMMPSATDDTNTELWPFPFPTIDHSAHEVLFVDDLHEDRETDHEYMDPYHPFYYHGNYDSSESKDPSSLHLDVSGWQRYLNDSKVQSDSSRTNLNYFTPNIKCENDDGVVEKSNSDLDICPTPVSLTLHRRDNQLPYASAHSPQDTQATEQQESDIRPSGIPQTVETGTSVQDFDSNYQVQEMRCHGTDYQGAEPQIFADTLHRKETSEFVRSFTSAMNVLENNEVDGSRSFQMDKEHGSNQNASATMESNDQMKNSPYGVSPKGKSEDSRPLKKRTDRFMRDFLTEVTNGLETNTVSCKKEDAANKSLGSCVETMLMGSQSGTDVESNSKPVTLVSMPSVDYKHSDISSEYDSGKDVKRIVEESKFKIEPSTQNTELDVIIMSPPIDNSEKSSVKDAFGKISDIVSMTRQALDAISTTTINTMKNLNG